MPNQFALNTTDHPNLVQLLVATRDGLFDYQAQQSASKVTVASNQLSKLAEARAAAAPNGKKYLVES